MDIQEYLKQKEDLYELVFSYIDCEEEECQENYDNLVSYINETNLGTNKTNLVETLYLILNISEQHNRGNNFISKIENLLLFLKNIINQQMTNFEVFNIFKNNKKILLFLFSKIIQIDEDILRSNEINQYPYQFYLSKKSQLQFSQGNMLKEKEKIQIIHIFAN